MKLNFSARWARAGWGAVATVSAIGPWHECESDDCSVMGAPSRDIGVYATVGLQLSRQLRWSMGTADVSVGVLNLLDANPPNVYGGANGGTVSDPVMYDYLGRYLYARLRQTF